MITEVGIYLYALKWTHIFLIFFYFLVSKTILQQKELELLAEMVDSRNGAVNIQNEPRISSTVRK